MTVEIKDVENQGNVYTKETSYTNEYPKEPAVSDTNSYELTGEVGQGNRTFWERLDGLLKYLNAEVRGVERIPEEERVDSSLWGTASMWFGANMVIATFSIGALGVTLFNLDFWTAFLVIIFFNFLGSQSVGLFSTFGPVLGLRQMIISRFWFGPYFAAVPSIINIISCIGWTAVNTIVSAQLLHTVNNGALPPWAGVIIVIVITFFISVLGYHVAHIFEKWAWIPNVVIFLILAIQMGRSHTFTYGTMGSGVNTAGSVLSFGATVYGFATGWTSYAADFTCYTKKDTSRLRIYLAVIVCLNTPLMLVMVLGAACAMGTLTNESWAAHYAKNSIGGLFYSILVEDSLHGFGQFCIVVLAMSTVSNNIPNLYSMALSAQTVWVRFRSVPRMVWTFIGAAVSLAIAIPAYYEFDNVMEDFMNLIGYWLAIYTAIGVSEHFFYKKGFKGYNPDEYDDPQSLPVGIAAGIAFCCGIGGAAVGMNQVWWVGPLAKKIGKYGGDIGFELCFGFAFVVFNVLRPFELRYFKR